MLIVKEDDLCRVIPSVVRTVFNDRTIFEAVLNALVIVPGTRACTSKS